MRQSQERTVLITGASHGIGLAIAHKMASVGWQVIGIARGGDRESFPGTLMACDLSNIGQTHTVLHLISQNHHIDGIVNNVGIACPQPWKVWI